jgi:hypothetical protein
VGFASELGSLLAEHLMNEIDHSKLEKLFQFDGEEALHGDERRRHERYRENLEIKVTWPGKGSSIGKTKDFSDGGTFVCVQFVSQPPGETEMLLQLNSLVNGREAPILRARVVRSNAEGIAFEFISDA